MPDDRRASRHDLLRGGSCRVMARALGVRAQNSTTCPTHLEAIMRRLKAGLAGWALALAMISGVLVAAPAGAIQTNSDDCTGYRHCYGRSLTACQAGRRALLKDRAWTATSCRWGDFNYYFDARPRY
jgi:hypothetical protein